MKEETTREYSRWGELTNRLRTYNWAFIPNMILILFNLKVYLIPTLAGGQTESAAKLYETHRPHPIMMTKHSFEIVSFHHERVFGPRTEELDYATHDIFNSTSFAFEMGFIYGLLVMSLVSLFSVLTNMYAYYIKWNNLWISIIDLWV